VNKKKQKNFVNLGPCRFQRPCPGERKFFASFLQKRSLAILTYPIPQHRTLGYQATPRTVMAKFLNQTP